MRAKLDPAPRRTATIVALTCVTLYSLCLSVIYADVIYYQIDTIALLAAPQNDGTSVRPTTGYQPSYANSLRNRLHWAKFPVRVAFTQKGPGWDRLNEIVQSGFDVWVHALEDQIPYVVVSDPKTADITVTYRRMSEPPMNGDELGITGLQYVAHGRQLRRAEIHINFWPELTRSDLNKLRNTATHEFGHALGIDGHSDSDEDIMYSRASPWASLSERDVNTLRVLYPGLTLHANPPPVRRFRVTQPQADRNQVPHYRVTED